jgi:hypothetical protein
MKAGWQCFALWLLRVGVLTMVETFAFVIWKNNLLFFQVGGLTVITTI